MADAATQIVEQVLDASERQAALRIVGGNTKAFFGRLVNADRLDVRSHNGIVDYSPAELVITVRGGTTLAEIEQELDANGQMLGFEPPRFGDAATIGGTLACNLSGPRRPWAGSVRDAVLGIRLINGCGEQLRFGGRVIKNVAGFDVSRLQAGALGVFGVISEVSLKVLPKPRYRVTLVQDTSSADAIDTMNRLAAQPKPLTGAAWIDDKLFLRLAGAESAVTATAKQWGGEKIDDGDDFWRRIGEQQLSVFGQERPLWRFSVKSTTALPVHGGQWLLDWAGAQRFLSGIHDKAELEALATTAGGNVSLYRGGDRTSEVFQSPPEAIRALHLRLKRVFDPKRVFNPGRLYSWL